MLAKVYYGSPAERWSDWKSSQELVSLLKSRNQATLHAASPASLFSLLRLLSAGHPWLRDLVLAHDEQQGRLGVAAQGGNGASGIGGAAHLDPVAPAPSGVSEVQLLLAAVGRYEAAKTALGAVDHDDLLVLAGRLMARELPRRLAARSIQ